MILFIICFTKCLMLVVKFQSHFTRLWDEACEACELKIPLWQNGKCILYPIT